MWRFGKGMCAIKCNDGNMTPSEIDQAKVYIPNPFDHIRWCKTQTLKKLSLHHSATCGWVKNHYNTGFPPLQAPEQQKALCSSAVLMCFPVANHQKRRVENHTDPWQWQLYRVGHTRSNAVRLFLCSSVVVECITVGHVGNMVQ